MPWCQDLVGVVHALLIAPDSPICGVVGAQRVGLGLSTPLLLGPCGQCQVICLSGPVKVDDEESEE